MFSKFKTCFRTSLSLFFISTIALAGSQGTVISGTKTANATITETSTYEWSNDKQCPPLSTYNLPYGTSITLPFSIVVTRSGPTLSSETGPVTGSVCLKNEGATATTQGLFATDQLEYQSGASWLPLGSSQTLPIVAELSPGENKCYNYEFNGINLTNGTVYQNHAIASIDNFYGFEGTTHSISITAPISITLDSLSIDEQAHLFDGFVCPTGFTCTPTGIDMTLSGSQTINYNVTITNNAAMCNTTFHYTNTADLTTNDTDTSHKDSCTTSLVTELCGCTGTVGYWKNHESLITPYLPLYLGTVGGAKTLAVTTTQIAVDVIEQNVYGSPSNGITKLYAQLLGAKIAIARGASPSPIGSLIPTVDAFLATHNYLDWTSLSAADQAMVLNWQTTFANYNLGLLGPPHC